MLFIPPWGIPEWSASATFDIIDIVALATVTITSKVKQLPVNTDFKFASGALAYFNDTQVKNSKPSGVELYW